MKPSSIWSSGSSAASRVLSPWNTLVLFWLLFIDYTLQKSLVISKHERVHLTAKMLDAIDASTLLQLVLYAAEGGFFAEDVHGLEEAGGDVAASDDNADEAEEDAGFGA